MIALLEDVLWVRREDALAADPTLGAHSFETK